MSLPEQLGSALAQVAVVFGVCAIVFAIARLFFPNRFRDRSFFKFLGLTFRANQFDLAFCQIWLGLVLFSVSSVFIEFHFSDAMRGLLTSDASPYAKILKSGFGLRAVLAGAIYCFIQASLAEELLFRGLIAKRLFNSFRFSRANVMQSLVFWLMHLLILKLITGYWFSALQVLGFVTSFGLGLVCGYVNTRNQSESIAPSWILHGSANFASFLSLAVLWPN